MTAGAVWTPVAGLNPATASFPAIAKVGEERVVIIDTGRGLRGVEPRCPHLQAAMTHGVLMGNGAMLRCPKHNFIFRLSDGKGVNCVGLNLKVYAVRTSETGLEVLI